MSTPAYGRFITLEGIEGVGKSTNMSFISELLDAHQVPHVVTREPGGTPLAEKIRHLLLESPEEPISDVTEVLLFFAARSQHISNLIQPTLERGDWVLCDRFTDSSLAYQGGGRQLGMSMLESLEQFVQGDLRPDLVVILDLPVELALSRVADRGGANRLDRETVDFFTRARSVFLERATAEPDRYVVVDASPDLTSVQESIRLAIEPLIAEYLS